MSPIDFIQGTTITFLSVLALTLAYLMLVRRINLSGLLHCRDGRISPGRVQALVATLAGAVSYLLTLSSYSDTGSLPPVPDDLLAIFGGSCSLYLAEKMWARWQRKSSSRISIL